MRYVSKIVFVGITCVVTSFSGNDVYVCNSKNAKRYHLYKECRGLANCKAGIVSISLEKAKADGKTLCGYED